MDVGTALGIAGLIIGVLGIGIAINEGRKYRGPKLSFQYDGFSLIRSYDAVFPESIEVTFGGEKVPNLTHSQMVIWNHGGGPITKSDVSTKDPLLFDFGYENKILQAEIIKRTSEPNAVSISYKPKDSYVKFDFEFLDSQDGVLISIWHTSPKTSPKLRGTIINKNAGPFGLGRFIGPKPNIPDEKIEENVLKEFLRATHYAARNPVNTTLSIMFVGSIFVIIGSVIWISQYFSIQFANDFLDLKSTETTTSAGTLMFFSGLLYSLTGFWMWTQVRRRFPKILLPDEYKVADET